MPQLPSFDIYVWRRRGRLAGRVLTWTLILAGGIAFLAYACSPAPTPEPDGRLSRYAVSAMRSFLNATSQSPGSAVDYFPTVDWSNADLPSAAELDQTITVGAPVAHGNGKYLVPLTVANRDGESEDWQLELAVTEVDGIKHYTPTGLPSPWPSITTDKNRSTPYTQTVDTEKALGKTVKDFLTNWLTGGEPGRYTVTADVAPAWPAPPFTGISVAKLRSNKPEPNEVSGEVYIQAEVAVTATYTRTVNYQLHLKAVRGNWMVDAVNPES